MTDHVLDYLETRAHKRRERWHTSEVIDLPEPIDMAEPTIVSRYTRCGMETRRRYIDASALVSVNGCFDTPSSVARDYLILKYKYGPKWTGEQRAAVVAETGGHPLYVKPCTFNDGYYVDIRSAYWSVMVRCGWDVNYWPGRWLCSQDPPLDFPWAYDKRARNSLVSVGRATQVTIWRPDIGYRLENRPNPRPNSQLYCLIVDCLNGIASEAVNEGAVYVFADGYIAPTEDIARRIIARVEEWGFEARIKGSGRGWVTNLGCYRVGPLKTRGPKLDAAEHNSIKQLPYRNWLKDRMQWATIVAPWTTNFTHQDYPRDRYSPSTS